MSKVRCVVVCVIVMLATGCTNTEPIKEIAESKESIKEAIANKPLPSWNDGLTKQAIIEYVKKVTDSKLSSYIPLPERIATFDNDGTLWAEKPMVQELFAMYRVKVMTTKDPTLAKKQPFKAVLEHDTTYFAKGGEKAILELINATHSGMTEDQFEASVRDFFVTATYPPKNVPVKQIVYLPQIELLNYLRENGFTIFICTSGGVEFVRGISNDLYGIPKDNVIGTTFKYKFVASNRSIIREAPITMFNDKSAKPVTIQQRIGQRPVFACGNEGGGDDIAMLKYSQGSKHLSFQMIINHDDSRREHYYQEKDNASLNAAAQNHWHVVSMKNDWRTVFPTK